MFLRAAARVRAAVPDAGFAIAGEGELMESLRETRRSTRNPKRRFLPGPV